MSIWLDHVEVFEWMEEDKKDTLQGLAQEKSPYVLLVSPNILGLCSPAPLLLLYGPYTL